MDNLNPNDSTLDDYDMLGKLDLEGFNFEMENLDTLKPLAKQYGFKIAYANPDKPHLWKRTKGHGVDLELEVPNRDGITYRLHIEESFQSHEYHYRKKWLFECRLPRFRNVPKSRFDIRVILTNRPNNMLGIRALARKHHVKHIVNLDALLDLITRLSSLSFYHPKPKPAPFNTTLLPITNPLSVSCTELLDTNSVYAPLESYSNSTPRQREQYLNSLVVRPLYVEWLRYKRDVEEGT
jgi:hypothetical protein